MAADITVSYSLHVNFVGQNDCNKDEFIQNKVIECMSLVLKYSEGYIWQNESFALVKHPSQEKGYPSMMGETNCGESIEDEWFIVYLLLKLSNAYPDIAISVEDDDGEFLLIEAAEHLPGWLKPETSENRVFIHDGKVKIIPLPSKPSEVTVFPTSTPSSQQSLQLIFGDADTTASLAIQNAIISKTIKFSNSYEDLFHYSHCYLPSPLSYALSQRPEMVALAVQSICKDACDNVEVERYTEYFNTCPHSLTRVKFTKLLYSQLLHKKLQPSLTSTWKYNTEKRISQKSNNLGFKLTAGFGLLCYKCIEIQKDPGKSDPRWMKFLKSLEKYGFFKDEMEGSSQWQILYKKADDFYLNTMLDAHEREKKQIESLVKLFEESKQVEHKQENILPEDDDSWLDITQDQLDELLKNRLQGYEHKEAQESASTNLEDLVDEFKKFVDGKSDFEGIETKDEGIQFNPSAIEEQLRKLLNAGNDFHHDTDDSSNTDEDGDLTDEDSDSKEDEEMQGLMTAMEEELRSTTIAGSFEKTPSNKTKSKPRDSQAGDIEPIDADYNLISNFLESLSSQEGLTGPVSNILTSMGMSFPVDSNE